MNTFNNWKRYFGNKNLSFDREPIIAFITLWMSYNSYYNQFSGRELTKSCKLSANSKAQKIYALYKDAILDSFSKIPHKDDSIRLFVESNLSDKPPVKFDKKHCKLKNFLSVVYQIRCNLFHGQKSPYIDSDEMLVKWAYENLYKILHEFNKNLF